MFLANSGKAYSKETREQEFIRYFRDTGAAKALQKAMITLFEMPIKPTNVREYFSEYLGNGAQQLIRLSLLKAELCYKHSETQDMHKRIQNLEQQILLLDSNTTTESLKEEENFYFEEGFAADNKAYDPMERFLEDLDDAPRGSVLTTATPSVATIIQEDIPDENKEVNSEDSLSSYDGEVEGMTEFEESTEVKCIHETNSELAFQRDIKNLDPWGIVCNFQPVRKTEKDQNNPKERPKGVHIEGDNDLSVMDSDSESEKNRKNYDSDDAETLAELYQTLAMDMSKDTPEKHSDTPHNDTDVKFLSVRNGPRLLMADLLGWSPLPSSTKFQLPTKVEADTNDPVLLKKSQAPRHWSEFVAPRNAQESETDVTTAPGFEVVENVQAQGQESTQELTLQDMDDSFLLEKDMERISQKLQRAWSDESCVVDFKAGFNSEMEEACAETCRHSSKPTGPQNKKEQGTMTFNNGKGCPCGEDCDCDCQYLGGPRFRNSAPGRMTNWTKDYECYPGEDYDLLGEDENVKFFRKKKTTTEAKKSSLEQNIMKDLALAPSNESGCQCVDSIHTMSVANCSQVCAKQSKTLQNQNKPRGSKDEETMTLTGQQLQKQEMVAKKLSEDPQELAQVFKSRRTYPSQEEEDEVKVKRKSSKKKKSNEDDGTRHPYLGGAYQLDLGKEVKKKFGL